MTYNENNPILNGSLPFIAAGIQYRCQCVHLAVGLNIQKLQNASANIARSYVHTQIKPCPHVIELIFLLWLLSHDHIIITTLSLAFVCLPTTEPFFISVDIYIYSTKVTHTHNTCSVICVCMQWNEI